MKSRLPTRRRVRLAIPGLAATLLASLLAPQMLSAQPAPQGPSLMSFTGAPFSGVRSQQAAKNFADGNRIDRGTSIRLYRDGQGRTREERDMPAVLVANNPTLEPTRITINDPVSGDRILLHPKSKTAVIYHGGATPALPRPSTAPGVFVVFAGRSYSENDAGWSKPVSLGEKDIEGLRSVGTRREYTIPVGEIGNEKPVALIVEQWFCPELGLMISKSGRASLGGEFNSTVESIVRGEPDAALFTIPSDYQRMEGGRVEGGRVTATH